MACEIAMAGIPRCRLPTRDRTWTSSPTLVTYRIGKDSRYVQHGEACEGFRKSGHSQRAISVEKRIPLL